MTAGRLNDSARRIRGEAPTAASVPSAARPSAAASAVAMAAAPRVVTAGQAQDAPLDSPIRGCFAAHVPVTYRVLGPIEAVVNGRAARLAGSRQRAVLAVLLL